MKRLLSFWLVLLTVFSGPLPVVAQTPGRVVDGSQTPGFYSTRNFIKNPGAEKSVNNVTASGGSLTRSTSSPLEGAASFLVDASSSSQTYDWALDSLEAGLLGQNCEARFQYNGDATLYTASVLDGSNTVSQTLTLSNIATGGQMASLIFPCGTTGTSLKFRLTSTSASAAAIKVDSVYAGRATSLSEAPNTTPWVQYTPTFTGFGTPSSVAVFSRRVGDTLEIRGTFTAGTTTATQAKLSIGYAGANGGVAISTTKGHDTSINMVEGYLSTNQTTAGSYTILSNVADTANLYFGLSSGSANGLAANNGSTLFATGTNISFYAKVPISGWASETVYRPEQVPWYVDANISGTGNVSLSTSAVTSYSPLYNSALTLVQNTGSAAVKIACQSGTAPVGTTCNTPAVNEAIGIAFTPPATGTYRVCASFSHLAEISVSSYSYSTFQLVEVNSSYTQLQEGKSRVQSGVRWNLATNNLFANTPHQLCGTFNFSSVGEKIITLQYEHEASGTVASNTLLADGGVNNGQRDIHFEVYPVTQNQPAPLLVGSVTSNSTGLERIERAAFTSVCSVSPCTITRQSGSWVTSITRNSTGSYTYNIDSSTFSALPTCTALAQGVSGVFAVSGGHTTSAINVSTYVGTTLTDAAVSVICMGPR